MPSQNNYLLDSNVVIDYLRAGGKATDVFQQIQTPVISAVTLGEVYQGAKDKKELNKIKRTLEGAIIIYINESICKNAIKIIEEYHLSIGLLFLDALIAATATENDLTLLTGNFKHFKPIKGLKIVKW